MKRHTFNKFTLVSCIILLFPYTLFAEDIPLLKQGGVYELPVEVNGVITLHFILDTGASEVNIPADVALTLYRTGTIRDTDFLPGKTYTLADGSRVKSQRFVLRHLKIGQRRIDNVAASIGDISSPLLLGQSFLEKLGSWGIDSRKQVLTLGPPTTGLSQKISPPSPTGKAPEFSPAKAAGKTENYPTATSSVGIPKTQIGDTYVIEYLNSDNPKASYTVERKVIAVSEDNITVAAKNVNSKTAKARTLRFTPEWNLLSSRNPDGSGFDYAPPLKYFAFPLYPGKTWQQTSQETNIKTGAIREHTLSATVEDWEDVSVPAGTFRALKITIHTTLLDHATGQQSTGTDLSWYAPTLRRSVKSDTTSYSSQGQQEKQLIQLMRYDIKEANAPVHDGVAKAAQANKSEDAAPSPQANSGPVVMPGKRVGNFSLGMSKEDVLQVAPKPQEDAGNRLVYKNQKTGNILIIHFQNDKSVQIDFTSKDFGTEEGIHTGNFSNEQYAALFDMWVLPDKFPSYKLILKTGGLTFYSLYVGSSDPTMPSRDVGVLHTGQKPLYDVQSITGKEHGGWIPWSQQETQTNKSEVAGGSHDVKEQEPLAEKHAMKASMAVFDVLVITGVIVVVVLGFVITIVRCSRTREGRSQATRDPKETKRIQEGFEIDSLPGKGRIQVRACAGFCGYYVQPTDQSCLNCGLIEPYRERPEDLRLGDEWTSVALLVGGLPLLSLFLGGVFIGFRELDVVYHIASPIYIVSAVCYMWLQIKAVKIYNILQYLTKRNSDCLINKEEKLVDVLDSHHSEMRRIEKIIRDNISLEKTEKNALALSTLAEVLQVRSCKSLQCEAILWEIGKARLVNAGLIVLSDKSRSNDILRENYMQRLKEHIEKGYTLIRKWQHDEDRRIQDVLTRLQESLTGCQGMRDELLAQQAKILATSVTNFESSPLNLTHISPEESEMFHTLGAATDTLFAGFGELEREYYRLLGEKEVIQELGIVD